jgi:hypothetical protein
MHSSTRQRQAPRISTQARTTQRHDAPRSVLSTPSTLEHLQRTVGNRTVNALLGAPGQASMIQRSFSSPATYVGNDPTTAFDRFKAYLNTHQVSAAGLTFKQEYDRVVAALRKMQPSKANEVETKIKETGIEKKPATAIADAAKLEIFTNYLNGLIGTFQLDTAATAVGARVAEGESHHLDYFFSFAGGGETKFDLDEWSRKDGDFLRGRFSGDTIKGIVNEAIADWDTNKGSIVTLLNERLLGSSGALGGSGATFNVPAVFATSNVGTNYTKILAAADHVIGVRTRDLKPRGVVVNHWERQAKDVVDQKSSETVDWPALLKTARAAFKNVMNGTAAADQDQARVKIIEAIWDNKAVANLRGLGVLDMTKGQPTFRLASGQKRKGNDVYQVVPDDRFGFDINHFTAILFFEWKAVYDLKRQA